MQADSFGVGLQKLNTSIEGFVTQKLSFQAIYVAILKEVS
jgi:hypothetical protein